MQPAVFALPALLIILLLFVPFLLGFWLLTRGLLGRRVGDHPICRKCGFDLFGRPEGVTRCSECGADLTQPHAIQIGHRERRPVMAWIGGFIFLIALGLLTVLGNGVLRNVQWIQLAPTWYVFRESQGNVPPDRTIALNELVRRAGRGELSDEWIGKIADAELKWQADANTAWAVERGDLIDTIHNAGKLPKDKWAGYLSRATQFRMVARPKVRRGDIVPVRIEEFADRCGNRTSVYITTQTKVDDSDLIVPKKYQREYTGSGSSGFSRGGRTSTGTDLQPDPKLLAAAADGTKTVRMSIKFNLYDHQVNSDSTEAPLLSETRQLQTTWDLLPADAVTVKKIEDASLKAAVEKSIKVNYVRVSGSKDYPVVNLSLDFKNVPVSIASKVYLRSGDREWDIGSIYVNKGGNMGWGTGNSVKGFDAETVDVVFRGDEKSALDTIDMTEYWTGEAVIKNVKVERPKE